MTLTALAWMAGCTPAEPPKVDRADPTTTLSDPTPTAPTLDSGTTPTDPGGSGAAGSTEFFDPELMLIEGQFGWDGTQLIDVVDDIGNPLSNQITITLSVGYPQYGASCLIALPLGDATEGAWAAKEAGGWASTTATPRHGPPAPGFLRSIPWDWGDDPGQGFADWGGWGIGVGPLSPAAAAYVPTSYSDVLVGGLVRSGLISGGSDDFYQTAGFAIDDGGALEFQGGDPVFLITDQISTGDGLAPGFYHLFALSYWQLR